MADRNISSKLPTILADYRMLLEHLGLQIVGDPSAQGVRETPRVVHHKDAPILAAAQQAAPGLPPDASDGPVNCAPVAVTCCARRSRIGEFRSSPVPSRGFRAKHAC